ncbi:MAG: bifunctional riboflavin kinase/FAD synthetase, partial [Eggerthellaceae bacterium]|nr:bifunctional riboflavin kinase/FAD synthetase [Eggerthellaceae bacterium]
MKKTSKIISLEEALEARTFKDSVCVIGVFDGMHVGHQMLIEESASSANPQ